MSNNNDIRHGRHCVFLMHVHLVFLTKYRREVFTKQILDDLRDIFASVCVAFEAELVEFIKGVSSRMIRKKNYPGVRKKLWGGALWPPSYYAGSCGGTPIEIVRQYIEQQQTPH